MSQMIFQYDALKIRVESADAAALHWLREFLTPSFGVCEGGRADHTIELVVDDHAYAELLNGERSESVELDCFALESRTVRLPLWRSTLEERVVFDSFNHVFYRVPVNGTGTTVLTATGNLAARFALMRVVRELAMTSARASGALVLHGAAMSTPAGAIVICGPKLAGKTTVLVHALRAVKGCFIANDRVVVDLQANEPMLHGMPTIVTLREPTLAGVPDLRESVLRSGYDHRLALGEPVPRGARAVAPRPCGPVDLSPAQFCSLLGLRACGHGPLRAVLFPALRAAESGIQVRTLSPDVAAQRLQSALFGTGSRGAASHLFTSLSFRDTVDDPLRVRLAVCERVPAFEWRLGPDAYRDDETLARLVDQVLGSRPVAREGLSLFQAGDKRRMTRRILLVGCDIPGWGGAATWQYQLLERMQRDGAEVVSVSLVQEAEEVFFRHVWGDNFANPRALENVHVCRLEGALWRRHERLATLIESLAPDLLVTFGVIATVLTRLAAPRLPVVFMTMGTYEVQRLIECGAVKDFMHFYRLASRGVHFPAHRTSREREAVEVADLIVVHSPVVRFAFEHALPFSVGKTLTNLVSVADFIYPDAERFVDVCRPFQDRDIDLIFIASGWGRPIKNYPLVEAIAARSRGLNIHIVGECQRPLSSCTYHGVITRRDDLYTLLGRSRTIVCPSLLDAAPGVLFEASSMGCNVIASPNCGNWDLCPEELGAKSCSPAEFERTIHASLAGAYPDNREHFRGGYRELTEVLSVF